PVGAAHELEVDLVLGFVFVSVVASGSGARRAIDVDVGVSTEGRFDGAHEAFDARGEGGHVVEDEAAPGFQMLANEGFLDGVGRPNGFLWPGHQRAGIDFTAAGLNDVEAREGRDTVIQASLQLLEAEEVFEGMRLRTTDEQALLSEVFALQLVRGDGRQDFFEGVHHSSSMILTRGRHQSSAGGVSFRRTSWMVALLAMEM